MNLAEKLSLYAYQLSFRDLPPEIVHEVKRRCIDALGCAIGALGSEPAKIVRQVVAPYRVKNGATLLGSSMKVSPDWATFYNGLLIRYFDFNDTYLSKEPAHPSDNISAALAVAQSQGRSGKSLIEAIVLAYEIQCRLCDEASIRARGWDHVTYGAFSSALAAAKLLGLSPIRMGHAVGLAGVANIALRQTRVGELSMWKGCAFANAARNGVFAALLAAKGMTGPRPIFEGKLGFFNLVSGPMTLEELGGGKTPFKIRDCCIKFYPAEYHAQGAIEAALELRHQEGLDTEEIESIEVKTFNTAIEIIGGEPEKWNPVSRETADHSLPYCVAVALMDGEVGLKQFSVRRIRDPLLQQLIQKVKIEGEPKFTEMYPKALPVHLSIQLKSGQVFQKEVIYPKGHAERPLSDAEVEEKFRRLTRKALSSRQQEKMLDRLWGLEKVRDVREVLDFSLRNVSRSCASARGGLTRNDREK